MQELITFLASFAGVFAAGLLLARLHAGRKFSFKRSKCQPTENAKVRMKTSDALYRCRLISHSDTEWVFSAPMQRDMYVPIRVGETVNCEVVGNEGLIIFQSQIIARRAGEAAIVVAAPKAVSVENRRDNDRREGIPMDVVVGGKTGSVMDLSPGGAKVRIRGFEREGNIVRIDLPFGESRGATVVDSKNDHEGSIIRLRFDEPILVPTES